jgi:hypothetical protein
MNNKIPPFSTTPQDAKHRDYVLIAAWILLAVIAGLLAGVTVASTSAVVHQPSNMVPTPRFRSHW